MVTVYTSWFTLGRVVEYTIFLSEEPTTLRIAPVVFVRENKEIHIGLTVKELALY